MENSLDLTEEHEPLNSPPRRRRSTFFVKRDSVVPQAASENVDPNASKTNTDTEKRLSDLSRYYYQLLQEKEQWKREVNERRHNYHDLRLQYKIATETPNRSTSYAALTNEDIEFLNAKPNLSKLVESAQKLHETTKTNVAFVRRLNELEDVALEMCENKVNKIIKNIFEHSSLESGE